MRKEGRQAFDAASGRAGPCASALACGGASAGIQGRHPQAAVAEPAVKPGDVIGFYIYLPPKPEPAPPADAPPAATGAAADDGKGAAVPTGVCRGHVLKLLTPSLPCAR